jgi:hypothetical protein
MMKVDGKCANICVSVCANWHLSHHALLLHPRGVRLSSLPQTTALEALYAMHMRSAVEGVEGRERFKVQRSDERADTVTFETQDLLFEHRE